MDSKKYWTRMNSPHCISPPTYRQLLARLWLNFNLNFKKDRLIFGWLDGCILKMIAKWNAREYYNLVVRNNLSQIGRRYC
jgi:hypothetical protein